MALSDTDTNAAATFNAEFLSKADGGTVAGALTLSALLTANLGITASGAAVKALGYGVYSYYATNDKNEASAPSAFVNGLSILPVSDAGHTLWPLLQTATGNFNGAIIFTIAFQDGYGSNWLALQIAIPLKVSNSVAQMRCCNIAAGTWGSWTTLIS